MKISTIAVLLAVLGFAAAGLVRGADQSYSAHYLALAPGDDPSTRGTLRLIVREEQDPDRLEFTVELYNAIEVTGIHLHLEGNSSNGLFGGPLFLALTNTSQAPVSSYGDQPLRQVGFKTSQDLFNNPQLPQVQARLEALGLNLADLGINLRSSIRVVDLQKLIDQGRIYGDVHTTARVSPQGLTRGRVSNDAYGNNCTCYPVRNGN